MIRPEYAVNRFPYWIELEVRFRDLDTLNHVNNALYSTYFEEARVRFTHTIPQLLESMQQNRSFVLVNLEIDFIKPVTYPATVIIGSAIESFGNSSLKAFQALYKKDSKELAAVARTTGVWFDTLENRPARLPDINNRDDYLFE